MTSLPWDRGMLLASRALCTSDGGVSNRRQLVGHHPTSSSPAVSSKVPVLRARHHSPPRVQVMELDPDGAMISYADMMKKQIVMPAEVCCSAVLSPS